MSDAEEIYSKYLQAKYHLLNRVPAKKDVNGSEHSIAERIIPWIQCIDIWNKNSHSTSSLFGTKIGSNWFAIDYFDRVERLSQQKVLSREKWQSRVRVGKSSCPPSPQELCQVGLPHCFSRAASVGNGRRSAVYPNETTCCTDLQWSDTREKYNEKHLLPVSRSAQPTGRSVDDLTKILHEPRGVFIPVSRNACVLHSSCTCPSSSEAQYLSASYSVPSAGMLHGLLHSSLRGGFPNYTFLVDDRDEVLIAKIRTNDVCLGEDGGYWWYTFYSLEGKGRKKGKDGWKYWRRKEKLVSELIGNMKVSSVSCSNAPSSAAKETFVLSEFVLYSAKPVGLVTIANQTVNLSTLSNAHPENVPVSKPTLYPLPPPFDILSDTAFEDGATSQSLSPRRLSVSLTTQERKSPLENSQHTDLGQRMSRARVDQSASIYQKSLVEPKERLCTVNSTNHCASHSELAAMVIRVPLETQEGLTRTDHFPSANLGAQHFYKKSICKEYFGGIRKAGMQDSKLEFFEEMSTSMKYTTAHQTQATITVILPAGHHGRPHSDTKGPSPLIERYKKGGQCDCKGWDLGCGLVVLTNDSMAVDTAYEAETSSRKNRRGQKKPLMLYKQDKDQQDAICLSLAPLNRDLISLEFRAPLSPLQAFAVAVATLHGRDPVVPAGLDECCLEVVGEKVMQDASCWKPVL